MWSGSRQSLDCRERFLVCFFFLGFFRVLGTSALLDLTAKILQGLEQPPEENWEQRSHPGGAQGHPGMSLWISANTWRGAKAAQRSVGFSRAESSRGRSCSSHPFPQIPALEGPSCSSNIPLFPQESQAGLCSAAAAAQSRICYLGPFPRNHKNSQIQQKAPRPFPRGFFLELARRSFLAAAPAQSTSLCREEFIQGKSQ